MASTPTSCSTGDANDGLVPGEEHAVRAWLEEQGFEPGDLRSEKELPFDDEDAEDELIPGEDITVVNQKGETPMHFACIGGHVSVCEWLFKMGADGHISLTEEVGMTPMLYACLHDRLPVCEWLFEMGAGADVTRANHNGDTPMSEASQGGYLSICKWLYRLGAEDDISRANNNGFTPMHVACMYGHLPVCEFLLEMGATKDIARANVNGKTPMYYAYRYLNQDDTFRRLPVCKWLVLNGALNQLVSISSISAIAEEVLVDEAFVELFNNPEYYPDCCPILLAWVRGVIAIHHIFLHVVLRGSVIIPRRRISTRRRCHLPRLPRDELKRIGSFLGVETGRRLRNVREFQEGLEILGPILERQREEEEEAVAAMYSDSDDEVYEEEFMEEFLMGANSESEDTGYDGQSDDSGE